LSSNLPILYSFRRCPYAMRARLGIASSQTKVELREVVLKDKPQEMLNISPKGTVPVLQLADGTVLEESLDIMFWALQQNDPDSLLYPDADEMRLLINRIDTDFTKHLNGYKYWARYEDVDPVIERTKAELILRKLEERLNKHAFLMGEDRSLGDFAIAPFIRQFAFVDKNWFDRSPYPALQNWLESFLNSDIFLRVMPKYVKWHSGDDKIILDFPK